LRREEFLCLVEEYFGGGINKWFVLDEGTHGKGAVDRTAEIRMVGFISGGTDSSVRYAKTRDRGGRAYNNEGRREPFDSAIRILTALTSADAFLLRCSAYLRETFVQPIYRFDSLWIRE
jgi:hypothetical protein